MPRPARAALLRSSPKIRAFRFALYRCFSHGLGVEGAARISFFSMTLGDRHRRAPAPCVKAGLAAQGERVSAGFTFRAACRRKSLIYLNWHADCSFKENVQKGIHMQGRPRIYTLLTAIAISAGAVILYPRPANATFFELVTSSGPVAGGCFPQIETFNSASPITGSGTCNGMTQTATANITTGQLGAVVASNGTSNGEAAAALQAVLSPAPNQGIVPLTVRMEVTGKLTGAVAAGKDVGFIDVSIDALDFGIVIADGATNVTTQNNMSTIKTQPVVLGVTETDKSLNRGNIDVVATLTLAINTAANNQSAPNGCSSGSTPACLELIEGQITAKAPPGFASPITADFLDPASFSFSFPAGVDFSSDGFLAAATAVPEPATWGLFLTGLFGICSLTWAAGRRGDRLAL